MKKEKLIELKLQSKYDLSFDYKGVYTRPDKKIEVMWDKNANHYQFVITRKSNGSKIKGYYSQSSAINKEPTLPDVVYSILVDTYDLDDFKWFCDSYGYDVSDKLSKYIYNACLKEEKQLKNMFSESEIESLRNLFEDY